MVQAPPAKFTIDDYHRMIDAGILTDRHVELLDGVITELPPEKPPHSNRVRKSRKFLDRLLGDRAEVSTCLPVTLSTSEPIPDISVVQAIEYEDQHPGPTNIFLLIEVANTSLKDDKERKRLLYAADSIQEYWILDLANQCLIVYREPQAGDYQTQFSLQPTEQISPLAFPDVAIAVQDLLKSGGRS